MLSFGHCTNQQPSLPSALTTSSPHYHQPSLPAALTTISPHYQQPSLPAALTTSSPHYQQPSLPSALTTSSPHYHQPSLQAVTFTILQIGDESGLHGSFVGVLFMQKLHVTVLCANQRLYHHILYHHIQSTAPLNFGGVHMHYIDTSHIVSPHSKHCTSQLWWGSYALHRHITYCIKALHLSTLVGFTCTTY